MEYASTYCPNGSHRFQYPEVEKVVASNVKLYPAEKITFAIKRKKKRV
jgi:hypothetical protein